jgi:hypothetical protein
MHAARIATRGQPLTREAMIFLTELGHWLAALDRPFAFLLALPFLVAVAGLAAHLVRQRLGRA